MADGADQARGVTKLRPNRQKLTRRRVPLSCHACRERKLKCNREKPCQNCIVRGEVVAASCSYAEKADKKGSGRPNPRSDVEDMKTRLSRLEGSILSMIESNNKQDCDVLSFEEPLMKHKGEASNQAGGQRMSLDTRSTHWDTILNEIEAMKDACDDESHPVEPPTTITPTLSKTHRPRLFSWLGPAPEPRAIIDSLPSRGAADKLVARFFDAYTPSLPAQFLLHKPTFMKQYIKHWSTPAETKLIWIGLLYGALCLAMQSYTQIDEPPLEFRGKAPSAADSYRIRAAQCLAIADITKPDEFLIETMMIYAMCEYTLESDGDMGTWLLSGTVMRLALQQGYHRDPSQHLNLTVFQGEMRRRVWTVVSQHEMIFSAVIGLPKLVKYAECDTQHPRNLHEEELYEDMEQLPPSRPLSEPTQVCYQATKLQIMRAYGYVLEFLHILQPQPYEEVWKLNSMLIEARQKVPSHLQLGTLAEMRDNPPYLIWEKHMLQHFYHKAICVLHRKFWNDESLSTLKQPYSSRKTCVISALSLLNNQALMHEASQTGGPLVHMKWYHFAITNHDFVLAAMILCLDVMEARQGYDRQDDEIAESKKFDAIQLSRDIWADIKDKSRDAKRAVKILDIVLNKLSTKTPTEIEQPLEIRPPQPQQPVPGYIGAPTTNSLDVDLSSISHAGYGTLAGSNSLYSDDIAMQDTFFDAIGADIFSPAEFNWDTFDQFVSIARNPQETYPDIALSF